LGTRRLTDFFRLPVDFNFDPYLPIAFTSFISPRVQTLELENTQSPSALMELFHTWSSNPYQMRILGDYDSMVLPKIYACLVSPSVKPVVISRILDIVDHIFTTPDEARISKIIRPHISLLITNLTTLIKETSRTGTMTSQLAQRQIGILRAICDHVTEEEQATSLIDLLVPSLRKPSKVVPETVKVDLLQAICRLLLLLDIRKDRTAALTSQVFEATSQMLQTLRVRQARLAAVDVFISLASKDPNVARVAPLIKDLNSFDPHRPEEPDFDRRIAAFGILNEDLFAKLSSSEWLPLLHNMLHFIHDREELSIRANASYAIRRFIEMLKGGLSSDRQQLFSKVLFTGLKNGLRTKHELVRTEIIGIIGFAVKECPQNPIIYDMAPLLANGDEEANFFNNIHHIQIHRRTRALRRLAEQCDSSALRSSTLNNIFVPMISHFIEDIASDHLLVNEAINTLAHIAQNLIWSRYYALVRQYMKGVKEKNGSEKPRIRGLIAVLGSFHFTMEERVPIISEDNDDDSDEIQEEQLNQSSSNSVKIADAVNNHLLPSLLRFMETREETEDVLRLSVAMGVVQVAMHLPEEKQRPQVTRIITILSQALKSKSSETRDTARDILCKLAVAVGPSYLVDIIRELRIALTRGPQLHVLAVTCHSLLHHLTTGEASRTTPISFDDVASSMSEIAAEVIFGQSSKELVEDSKATMREVRSASSKGLDSMTILSRFVSPSSISHVLTPIKSIMYETESTKVMSLVDETLKRISGGLNSNTSLDPAALLSLCHSLISQNAKFLQEKLAQARKEKGKNAFTVQTKRDLPQALNHYAHNSYRFVVLGLDLFVVAFRRNRFDFKSQDTISRLEPMLSVIGNTLYSAATEVVVLGLKAAAAILRAPLSSASKSLPVIIRQQVQIIKQSGSTESEVAQAALKSLAAVLRECTGAQLKENDLKFLIQTMEPDLEEVERQAAVFSLLRSIIARKLVVPEIYDMMDKVASVMVTNQSTQVQETCRNILLQFLLDYPQGKGRLRKQMTFLASNLGYIHESGRLSVMEILTAMFNKFAPGLLEEYAELFFASLVMVLANDDSAECRKKAANLIRSLYQVVGKEPRLHMFERLHIWASQASPSHLASVAAQVYGLVLDSSIQDMQGRLPIIVQDLYKMLERASQQQEIQESSLDMMEIDLDWQSPYHALTVLTKIAKLPSDTIDLMDAEEIFSSKHVVGLMLFPHAWVRMAASRHIGTLYSLDKQNKGFDSTLSEYHPASPKGMIVVAQNSAIQLQSENLDQQWALQIVKNLVYLGKAFYGHKGSADASEMENGDSSEDESDTESNEDTGSNKVKSIAKAPLPWMFSRLSYQIKSAHIEPPAAIFQWFAAMTTHMNAVDVEKYLVHILTPVYRISEDDTTQEELKATASELQDLVQSKVGVTAFTSVYSQIRQGALAIQRDRKASRAMLAASNPQLAAKRQVHRNLLKKESKKRKFNAFRFASLCILLTQLTHSHPAENAKGCLPKRDASTKSSHGLMDML
ncbi:2130_t:CDS:2, partial [Acaulospora colombiana]